MSWWKFWNKKKPQEVAAKLPPADPYIRAIEPGVCDCIMYDHLTVGGVRYETLKPMVRLGEYVRLGQVVGKK